MPLPDLSFEDLVRITEPVLRARVHTAERMTFGDANLVFLLHSTVGDFVFRANEDAAVYRGTGHTLSVLRSLGLPVSKLVHLEVDAMEGESRFSWMLLEAFQGRDLRYELASMSAVEMTRLAGQIVEFQRIVGTLPFGSGYGWVQVNGRAPFASWPGIIERDLRDATERGDQPNLAARARTALNTLTPVLQNQPAVPFLDDITIKNVIIKGGTLQGLVDFDWICYGDPLYHLALTAVAVVADVGEPGTFYVSELHRLWPVTSVQEPQLALYKAVHGLDFAARFLMDGDVTGAARVSSAVDLWLRQGGF